mgnify:CR=1 FL=1
MKVFIIAEAGVNHNGSLEVCRKLIDVAVKAGADAVKFQTFRADRLVTATASRAEYQIQGKDAYLLLLDGVQDWRLHKYH